MGTCWQSFRMGMGIGLASKPLPLAKKEPIAYLYNGVRLPKLPEWDREVYPYAYIQTAYGDTYLFVSDVSLELRSYNPAYGYAFTHMNGTTYGDFNFVRYELNDSGDAWGDKYEAENVYFAPGSYDKGAVWCNTDLYRYDKDTGEATLVQTASEPVPVYK